MVIVPICSRAFDLDADPGRGILFTQAHGKAAHARQIRSGIAVPHPTLILAKGDIEDPMEPVFDGPMPSSYLSKNPLVSLGKLEMN